MDETIGVRINYNHSPWFDLIHLPIINYKAPDDFTGFPETSGIIAIEAPHFQRKSNGNVTFEHIPYLGTRTDSGSLALRPYKDARVSEDVAGMRGSNMTSTYSTPPLSQPLYTSTVPWTQTLRSS